ncbi:MAG: peptidoglycan recognition family protein [Patescibacteria group bacterium]
MPNVPDKIIVHHTAIARQGEQIAQINAAHEERGFPQSRLGFFVGYHFLIDGAGNITRTREDDEEGAHTVGQNTSSLGVGLEGDFNLELPTKEQAAALGGLLGALCEQYSLGVSDIFPHRAYSPKDCYGTLLSNDWARLVFLESYGRRLRDKMLQICKENNLKPF